MNVNQLRVGIGHDTHRLEPGRPLKIGGVEIPHDRGLVGHSDADVLLHAITDAILGAAGMGDIGELFPDSDPGNAGRDSSEMLQMACGQVAEGGFQILNVDCTVFAEKPRLTSFKRAMREHIANVLGIAVDCVGVKAKTGEGLDAVGQQQAIGAECAALLAKLEGH